MNGEPFVVDTERELRVLSAELTEPRRGECLLCYVWRMLDLGCTGLRWATHYRDRKAPRATALERRLGERGGFCDCEIFLNGYELAPELWTPQREVQEGGLTYVYEAEPPAQPPPCRGVRAGSTRGCTLWVRQYRGWW